MQHTCLIFVSFGAESLINQMDVGLMQVIGGDEIHFELEKLEELGLADQYLFLGEGAMRNFL